VNNQTNIPTKTVDPLNVIDLLGKYRNQDDPELVLKEAGRLLDKTRPEEALPNMVVYKAQTLLEFENGTLMTETLPDELRTLAIDMLRKLIQEYNCQTIGEKATAELATINYMRTLDLQRQLHRSMEVHDGLFYSHKPNPKDSFYGELSNRCLACERSNLELKNRNLLSKELERANKNFLFAINTLRIMRQGPLQINIKTNSANIAQNQMVQEVIRHE
jgi:hypothetical protein